MNMRQINPCSTHVQLCFLLLLIPLSFACAKAPISPDFGAIYNRSAMEHGIDRNPVIVLPGILGSRLVDKSSGQVAWGAFGSGYADPSTSDGLKLIALPMQKGVALGDLKDTVGSDGALEQVNISVFGLPVSLNAYKEIISTLGAGGYRDEALGMSGAVDYGSEHFTCFQFDYDWRYHIAHSAAQLYEYIKKKRTYVAKEYEKRFGIKRHDIRFDIVAHSMGGLVTRYFLRYGSQPLPIDGSLPKLTWEGAKYVSRVILVGTPNAGSVESYGKLRSGAKYSPIHPRYPAALLGTMPSLYGLLPRPRHKAIVSSEDNSKIDLYDVTVWQKNAWGLFDAEQDSVLQQLLPDAESREERLAVVRDHLEKTLRATKQIHQALDLASEPPKGLSLSLIAGDAIATDAVISVDFNSGSYQVSSKQPGDGTVLRSSALLDERVGASWQPRVVTPLHWDKVMFLFSDHLAMTKDPSFTDNVLYTLLEQPM